MYFADSAEIRHVTDKYIIDDLKNLVLLQRRMVCFFNVYRFTGQVVDTIEDLIAITVTNHNRWVKVSKY